MHRQDRAFRATWVALYVGFCSLAQAQSADETNPSQNGRPKTELSAEAGMFLPETMAPRVDSQRAFALVFGGYDLAARQARLEGTADVSLIGPLAARVGILYNDAPNKLRPTAGLRLQALSQLDEQGIDMSVGAFYRPEGFTEAEGEVEAVLGFGRKFGRFTTFANLVYGQDPEGAERDGEVRLAGLYALTARLQSGFDARLRFDLGSEPGKRRAEGGASYDFIVGPAITYSLGTVALLAHAGFSGVDRNGLKLGVAGLAGLGGAI